MKKFLSLLLTVISVFIFSLIAFSYENVDNTFDNFTPAIGKTAPSNWYDPCCYDENGLLRKEALSGGNQTHSLALYCKKYKKIFTTSSINTITKNGVFSDPYSYKVPLETSFSGHTTLSYCPYCGEKEELPSNEKFNSKHIMVFSVAYGADCPDCGLHNITYNAYVSSKEENNGRDYCRDCKKYYAPEKFTRYISSEMLDAEYSFILEETAYKYGNGTDCLDDDLIFFSEDDIYIRNNDVPKNVSLSMMLKKYLNAIYRWIDKILYAIKNIFGK